MTKTAGSPTTVTAPDLIDWIPVALSVDVPPATAAPGQIDGRDLVVWRAASGRIAVWSDRCPHRGMRLSHGFVRGEALSCIYHGWSYGQDGGCRKIPAHPDLVPPEAIRVPVYRVAEANGLVWASVVDEPGPVPSLPGLAALRFVEVARPVDVVTDALGALRDGVQAVTQARGDATGVYVLVPDDLDPAGRAAVSAMLESLRRVIEDSKEQAA